MTAVLHAFISMAPQKNTHKMECAGHSRGGLTTKIHAAVDALGNPVRLLLTAGQASEYHQANALIEGFEAEYVLADRGMIRISLLKQYALWEQSRLSLRDIIAKNLVSMTKTFTKRETWLRGCFRS